MNKIVTAVFAVAAIVVSSPVWAQNLPALGMSDVYPEYGPMPGTAPRNVAALNPAFVVTPKQVEAAVKRGQQLSRDGKTEDDVRKLNAQLPRGIRGERGRSHESYVNLLSLDAYPVVWQAFSKASKYESLALSVPLMSGGMYMDSLYFTVSLASMPRDQGAAEGDVKVQKFVVTDDQDNIFQPLDVQNPGGVTQGTTYDSGIGYPYYYAFYQVRFPLFKQDGQPYITAKTRKLTLHIITGTGERVAEFNLTKPKE